MIEWRTASLLAATLAAAWALTPRDPARAEVACGDSWHVPTLVTDTSQALPREPADFALVLLAESSFHHEQYRSSPFSAGFALTRRGQRVPLVVEELGVGVALLRTPNRLALGLWRLEGLPTPASINIAGAAVLPAPPAAPSDIFLTMPRVRTQSANSDSSREVVAHLADGAPRSSMLLAYWDGELGAAARVRPRDTRVTLFRPLRCGSVRPGMRAPSPSAVRELAWMDGFGRMSERFRVP